MSAALAFHDDQFEPVRSERFIPDRLPIRNCVTCAWCVGGCGLGYVEFACARPGVAREPLNADAMVGRCHWYRLR